MKRLTPRVLAFLAGILLLGQVLADAWAVDPGCCHDGKPCPMMTLQSSSPSCSYCVGLGLQSSWPGWPDRSIAIERAPAAHFHAIPVRLAEIWRPPAV